MTTQRSRKCTIDTLPLALPLALRFDFESTAVRPCYIRRCSTIYVTTLWRYRNSINIVIIIIIIIIIIIKFTCSFFPQSSSNGRIID